MDMPEKEEPVPEKRPTTPRPEKAPKPAPVPEKAPEKTPYPAPEKGPTPEQANILVVDDNASKRMGIVAVLESLAQNIVSVESGRDALRALLDHEYAVILLDVQMPVMNGFETAELIRSRAVSESTPIIFITAYTHEETDMLRGYGLGAVDFIFTPIIPAVLQAKVAVFIELFEKSQALKQHEEHLEGLVEERTAALTAEISERIQAQERLRHLAHHDTLTGMPNRILFVERLKQVLSRAQWHKRAVAVLFFDLDRFKVVNDTLGHDAGDQLLRMASQRLLTCLRDGDTLARFGGDEFAAFLDDIASPDDVPPIIREFLQALAAPFTIDGHEFFISGSIGVSLYPSDGNDTKTLMKNADTAMYRAKQQGGNSYQFYRLDMNAQALQRLELETCLRRALERREFVLHYQPQFDLANGSIVRFKALLRWQRPGVGLALPLEFISILEETGLIAAVGEWVLHTACAQHKLWRASLPTFRMAVNISGRQFDDNNLAEIVRRTQQCMEMDLTALELEITESVLMKNTQSVMDMLQEMSAMGVRFAVDDFGTGYSSLSYLKRFPIHILKIDQTFVRDITDDADDAAIVSAIITMAHSLGLKTIAEGVETREQLEFLRVKGCDFAQGYYFSAPQSAEEITELLEAHHFDAQLIATQR